MFHGSSWIPASRGDFAIPIFILTNAFSAVVIWFCPFSSSFRQRLPTHIHPLQKMMQAYWACLTSFDWVGPVGLLRPLLLLLSINSCRVGLLGLLSYSLFFGPIQGPFLLLEEGHLTVANSYTLNIYRSGSMCLIPCSFMDIPSS